MKKIQYMGTFVHYIMTCRCTHIIIINKKCWIYRISSSQHAVFYYYNNKIINLDIYILYIYIHFLFSRHYTVFDSLYLFGSLCKRVVVLTRIATKLCTSILWLCYICKSSLLHFYSNGTIISTSCSCRG